MLVRFQPRAPKNTMKFPTYKYETQKYTEGFLNVAGCDEVGMGPLAGPVVAATVILDPDSIFGERTKDKWWYRVRDSKTTSEKERTELVKFITDHCLSFAVGEVPHGTIDKINIRQASLLAMKNSVDALQVKPDFLFIDGINQVKKLSVPQQAIIGGDALVLSIAAASIVAKVARDEILVKFDELYPQYGFVKHKGYGTKQHREAIAKFGLSPVHRRSFVHVQDA